MGKGSVLKNINNRIQPIIRKEPPKGVNNPINERFVRQSKYNEPEKKSIPNIKKSEVQNKWLFFLLVIKKPTKRRAKLWLNWNEMAVLKTSILPW